MSKIDALDKLEDALAAVGLATEEDLYSHQILQPQDTLSKIDVRERLFQFVEKAIKQKNISVPANIFNHLSRKDKMIQLKQTSRRRFSMPFLPESSWCPCSSIHILDYQVLLSGRLYLF